MRGHSRRRRRVAEQLAAELRADARVEAVLLYGSVLRGEAARRSDIDVFVVAEDLSIADVVSLVPWRWRRRLGVTVRPYERLHPAGGGDWSTLTQLARHGRPLLTNDRVTALLALERPPREQLLARLEHNARLAQQQPELAHRMARRCAYLANAAAGEHAYRRDVALETFAARHPDVRGDAARVARAFRQPRPLRRLLLAMPHTAARETEAAARVIAAAREELAALPY